MNHNTSPSDDSWESDAVWNLLDQAAPKTASARFLDDTVRAARLDEATRPWWKRLLAPAPLVGFAAATAALAFAMISLVETKSQPVTQTVVLDSPHAVAIQDIAETETLMAAVDQLEDFSDNELVSLIGF